MTQTYIYIYRKLKTIHCEDPLLFKNNEGCIQVLGGAVLVGQAFLPGAEGEGEDDEEESAEH